MKDEIINLTKADLEYICKGENSEIRKVSKIGASIYFVFENNNRYKIQINKVVAKAVLDKEKQ